MPKTTKAGKPKKGELPSTLQRSNAKAQCTFAKTHDSAAEQYGDEQRAHRVAHSAVKHSFERSATTDEHISAFPGKRDRDGAAKAAIAAGDDRPLVGELSRAAITLFAPIGNRIHTGLDPGHGLLPCRKAHEDFLPGLFKLVQSSSPANALTARRFTGRAVGHPDRRRLVAPGRAIPRCDWTCCLAGCHAIHA
jgi:cation transport regulator ChaB